MDMELKNIKDDIVMWAVCSAIGSQHELIDKMNLKNIDGKTIADIKFNVNGVDLDFRKVMEAIESNVDKMVGDKAKELIEENFEDLNKTLEEFKTKILCESNKLNTSCI